VSAGADDPRLPGEVPVAIYGGMQLRRTLTAATVGLGLITFTACVALISSTTLLRRTIDDLDRAHQVARLASSLAHQSIRYELE
jgi:hypothetical protein